jgi:hypothetical protein
MLRRTSANCIPMQRECPVMSWLLVERCKRLKTDPEVTPRSLQPKSRAGLVDLLARVSPSPTGPTFSQRRSAPPATGVTLLRH